MVERKADSVAAQNRSASLGAPKKLPPLISNRAYKAVSDERKQSLANEVDAGLYRDGSYDSRKGALTSASFVAASHGINKSAQAFGGGQPPGIGGGGARGWEGAGGTVNQIPEVYSPLWLNSNINLPRDRATINAWNRSFFALQPFVQNAINLHSTYPISKLNIKCANPKQEQLFNDMNEEIDLLNICTQVAQEYWLLGEAFVYAELNERAAKWSRLIIQNPDYIVVKRSVIASEPIIMLRPDENLRRICFSNRPADIEQRRQLNETIVEHIKRGENVPLDNFYVSHLARRISPYEVRGTGLPVCCFRQLMLFDLLRECYDDQTEVLTDVGFKKNSDITVVSNDPNVIGVSGAAIDNGSFAGIIGLVSGLKIATFNPETESIQYEEPKDLSMSYYEGKMHHFKDRNLDIMVSPNHKMWAQKRNRLKGKNGWYDWEKINASEITDRNRYKFRGIANWTGKKVESVNVIGKEIPIELYLKFLGYVISEGYLGQGYIDLCQKITSSCIDDIKTTMCEFAAIFDKKASERIRTTKDYKKAGFKKQPADRWNGRIYSKELMQYFIDIVSTKEKSTSTFKKVPEFVKELDPSLMMIFLGTMLNGDGSFYERKNGMSYKYWTSSKRLADDIQEMVFKCGYAPALHKRAKLRGDNQEYHVAWSDTQDGRFPWFKKKTEVDYKGVVWCLETSTGLFVTRRNGKIAIQGNSKFAQANGMINPLSLIKIGSADYKPQPQDLEYWRDVFASAQYDKDFKIFTHEGVSVERVGWNQGIYDISGDITQLLKEIFMGLMVPEVLMSGGGDISYSNGGISLDVLRDRYFQFRNYLASWLRKKIFAPIAKLNEFYEYKDGQKQLLLPSVEFNHMSLFDTSDYVNVLVQLSGEPKKVSQQTLYNSLGLDYEEERAKIRKEDIMEAIRKKEMASLDQMPLNELRSIGEDDEIPEAVQSPIPGMQDPNASPYGGAGAPGGDTGMGGMGGLGGGGAGGGLGGLPPMPGGTEAPLGGAPGASPAGGAAGAPPAGAPPASPPPA